MFKKKTEKDKGLLIDLEKEFGLSKTELKETLKQFELIAIDVKYDDDDDDEGYINELDFLRKLFSHLDPKDQLKILMFCHTIMDWAENKTV